MVTCIPGGIVNEYRGRSDDTKPVERVPNGSTYLAINTGDIFMFDADSKQWFQQYASQDPAGNS